MKVAIQGIKGSYHHQVAIEFFSDDIEIDECMSFDALIVLSNFMNKDGILNKESKLRAFKAIDIYSKYSIWVYWILEILFFKFF